MNLLKKISKPSNDVEKLLEKIFDSDSAPSRDDSPTDLAELFDSPSVEQSARALIGPENRDRQQVEPEPHPSQGWLETEAGAVEYFVDDLGRMWTGGQTPGGGERWTRHKAGDRGAKAG